MWLWEWRLCLNAPGMRNRMQGVHEHDGGWDDPGNLWTTRSISKWSNVHEKSVDIHFELYRRMLTGISLAAIPIWQRAHVQDLLQDKLTKYPKFQQFSKLELQFCQHRDRKHSKHSTRGSQTNHVTGLHEHRSYTGSCKHIWYGSLPITSFRRRYYSLNWACICIQSVLETAAIFWAINLVQQITTICRIVSRDILPMAHKTYVAHTPKVPSCSHKIRLLGPYTCRMHSIAVIT